MKKLCFAHVSDTHLVCAGSSEFLHQVRAQVRDPRDTLEQCLLLLARWQPDFVLLTGDLIHEGEAQDYANLRGLFDRHLPGVPLAVALGNHDHRGAFRQGFLGQPGGNTGPYLASTQVGGLGIISLDTPYERGMEGTLPPEQMDFLRRALEEPAPRGHILLMHHPVIGLEGWGLMAPTKEFEALVTRGDVKAIFTGHLHRNFCGQYLGIPHFTTGSLAFGIDMEFQEATYTDQACFALCSLEEGGFFGAHQKTIAPARRVLKRKRGE